MSLCEAYHMAGTVEDALRALDASPGPTRIIAGGTDLLLEIQRGSCPPLHTLVDVTQIPELCTLEIRQGYLFIGASLTHRCIAESSILQQHCQALAEACGLIGGPQLRNTATIGGNVAHALPAADGTIALMALDARVDIASLEGRRSVLLGTLFSGPGESTLHPKRDILVGFHLPRRGPGQASAFGRVMRPQGVALAILNMAIWLQRKGDQIVAARISVGPSGPTPRRLLETEQILKGKSYTSTTLAEALEVLLSEAHFRTSRHRAMADYRRHLAGVLLEDVFQKAWARAAI